MVTVGTLVGDVRNQSIDSINDPDTLPELALIVAIFETTYRDLIWLCKNDNSALFHNIDKFLNEPDSNAEYYCNVIGNPDFHKIFLDAINPIFKKAKERNGLGEADSKTCKTCKQTFDLSFFYKRGENLNGFPNDFYSSCKKCERAKNRLKAHRKRLLANKK